MWHPPAVTLYSNLQLVSATEMLDTCLLRYLAKPQVQASELYNHPRPPSLFMNSRNVRLLVTICAGTLQHQSLHIFSLSRNQYD
ncbi:hypothetical protein DL96DRAFT_1633656 [Flagelloscypha sp. PMI_526]|nr:hypothetical protein DL96DRAFT_1633656 [Flagelloscypha sp. PMI_526]